MGRQEPHPAVENSVGHSDDRKLDPAAKRALLAAKARKDPKLKFNNLMHHLTGDLVSECLNNISRKSAPGVDGMTVEQARENLAWILPPSLQAIHRGSYQAPPVRRVYIPKADGSQRPLGVPQVVDRAIQAAMVRILGEIYEQDFLVCSFGFRPNLGCHHAIATLNRLLYSHGMNYALEVDIRDFFGSLNHEWLRKFLELRIGDSRVLKLIDTWLKAGVMEKGKWTQMTEGTPQGGAISPLLANIYLHYVLDLWFEKKIKKGLHGKAHLVRYADDFVILFSDPRDIEDVRALLKTRLAQFGLEIAEQKTHVTDLSPDREPSAPGRRQITFLGFKIFRAKANAGQGWKVVHQTENKRLSRAKAAMKATLLKIRHHSLEEQAAVINPILLGHYAYYGMAGNSEGLWAFQGFTLRAWRRCLSRRSQKGATPWWKMREYVERFSLGEPLIRIPYEALDGYVRL